MFGSLVLLLLAPISVVLGASPFALVAHFFALGASGASVCFSESSVGILDACPSLDALE